MRLLTAPCFSGTFFSMRMQFGIREKGAPGRKVVTGENNSAADIPNELAATSLERVAAVRERLAAFEITDPVVFQVFLAVLDQLGLFHDRIFQEGVTSKKARRQAKKAKSEVDRLKIMSKVVQTNRGGRVIPDRSTGGRRPEPEITRGLQILDRYLSIQYPTNHYPNWTGRYREECLADVLRAAGGISAELRDAVIGQVHDRLQTAKDTPLDDWDYGNAIRDVLAVKPDENLRRYAEWKQLMAEANDPNRSEEELAQAEAKLGRLVGSI